MASTFESASTPEFLFNNMERLRHKWKSILGLGILTTALGVIALLMIPVATVAAGLVLGWLMLLSGVGEGVHAFKVRRWSGVFLHMVVAILGVLTGLLLITHPLAGALAWTLLIASFLTIGGAFRIVTAVYLKFAHWGWAVLDGSITLALGLILWLEWPVSGFWFLGLAVGISLLLRGWSYVMLAGAVRSIPAPGKIQDTSLPRAA